MTSSHGSSRAVVLVSTLLACVLLAACAAEKPAPKSAEAPSQASGGYPESKPAASAHQYQPQGQPAQPGMAQPYPSPPAPPPSPSTAPETPAAKASRELDTAERELSVAAGDCNNACRALGSMDRAAGNICKLSTDKPRCDDATTKVRTARDKVKSSCGECKETSTDSRAPVPSR